MNALQKRWVEALESGKYKQGRDSLRLRDGFCCLGVLCDVIDPNAWKGIYWSDRAYTPPPPIAELVSLTEKQLQDLADMNDLGVPFTKIAAHLRELWDK